MARCSANDCNRWRPGLLQHVSGVTISDRWFCSRTCVEQMAHDLLIDALPQQAGIPGLAPSRLGTLLRHYRALTAAQLDEALRAQDQSGLMLGAQLLALKLVDSETIVRALAAQAGVRYLPFVDPECVRSAPGGLSRDAVRALGLVPFSEVRSWRQFNADLGEDTARAIREYFVPDFSGWETDHGRYLESFEKLLASLKSVDMKPGDGGTAGRQGGSADATGEAR